MYDDTTIFKILWRKVKKGADREGTCRMPCRSYHLVLGKSFCNNL